MLIWFDSSGSWGFVENGVPSGWDVHVERVPFTTTLFQMEQYVAARLELLRALAAEGVE